MHLARPRRIATVLLTAVAALAVPSMSQAASAPSPAARPHAGNRSDLGPTDWMAEAFANVVAKATMASAQSNYALDRQRISLLGAFMHRGVPLSFTWHFRAGEEVMLIGGGDRDVIDLDLTFTQLSTGRVVASDTARDATPIVTHRIPADGRYRATIVLSEAPVGSFCTLALLLNGDSASSLTSIARSVATFLEAASLVGQQGGPSRFPTNRWGMFGMSLRDRENENVTISGLDLTTGSKLLAVSDDLDRHDIDLIVRNAQQREIASDVLPDGFPMVGVQGAWFNHSVTVLKANRRGNAFAVFGILES